MKNFIVASLVMLLYAGLCSFILYSVYGDVLQSKVVVTDSIENNSKLSNSKELLDGKNDTLKTAADTIMNTDVAIIDTLLVTNASDSLPAIITDTTTQVIEKAVPSFFQVNNHLGKSIFKCNGYARSYFNKAKIVLPAACNDYLIELKNVLVKNDSSKLTITGITSIAEDNYLGLQRARYIKQSLINVGAPANKIKVDEVKQEMEFKANEALGGISLQLFNPVTENAIIIKEPEALKPVVNSSAVSASKSTRPFAYRKFTSGYKADYFYGNTTIRNYNAQVAQYLKANPNRRIIIYAHTDNVGNNNDNLALSRQNAAAMKRLMVESGVSSSRIRAIGKGEQLTGTAGTNRAIIVVVK